MLQFPSLVTTLKSNEFVNSYSPQRATSKMHRFKPAVSLNDALVWADAQDSSNDITLVFENDNSMRWEESKFVALDLDSDA